MGSGVRSRDHNSLTALIIPPEATLDELAAQIWRLEKVVILGQAASAPAETEMDSMEQALLEAVRAAPGVNPARIAEQLAVTRPAITKRLRSLAGRGLVLVAPDASDGRRQRVSLTELGTAELARVERLRSENARGYLDGWEPEDSTALVELLGRLADRIEQMHVRDHPGWDRGANPH